MAEVNPYLASSYDNSYELPTTSANELDIRGSYAREAINTLSDRLLQSSAAGETYLRVLVGHNKNLVEAVEQHCHANNIIYDFIPNDSSVLILYLNYGAGLVQKAHPDSSFEFESNYTTTSTHQNPLPSPAYTPKERPRVARKEVNQSFSSTSGGYFAGSPEQDSYGKVNVANPSTSNQPYGGYEEVHKSSFSSGPYGGYNETHNPSVASQGGYNETHNPSVASQGGYNKIHNPSVASQGGYSEIHNPSVASQGGYNETHNPSVASQGTYDNVNREVDEIHKPSVSSQSYGYDDVHKPSVSNQPYGGYDVHKPSVSDPLYSTSNPHKPSVSDPLYSTNSPHKPSVSDPLYSTTNPHKPSTTSQNSYNDTRSGYNNFHNPSTQSTPGPGANHYYGVAQQQGAYQQQQQPAFIPQPQAQPQPQPKIKSPAAEAATKLCVSLAIVTCRLVVSAAINGRL